MTVWEVRPTHPDGFGGHEFVYEQDTDLFKCANPGCGKYEISVRHPGGITPCQGSSRSETMDASPRERG